MRRNLPIIIAILLGICIINCNNIYANTTFDVQRKSMKIYEKLDLSTIISTDSDNLNYESSNSNIATVSEDGIVTTYGMGDFNITVSDENSSDTCMFSSGYFTGIDVSNHNGLVDWQKVKKAGIDFVMIRASYGYRIEEPYDSQYDKQFANNIKGAYDNNIPFGIFHFSYAEDTVEAEREANYLLSALDKYGSEYKDKISLPIAYDVEHVDTLSKKELTDIVITFCSKIYDAGYVPMVYSNTNFFTNHLDLEKLNALAYNFWYANIDYDDFTNKITIKDTKISPFIWQYTFEGSIEGANNDKGCVDMDVMYMKDRVKVEVINNGQVVDVIGADKGGVLDYVDVKKKGYTLTSLQDNSGQAVTKDTIFNNDSQINAVFDRIGITDILLEESEINIDKIGQYKINVKPMPETAIIEDDELIFESDDENVATVESNGNIIINGNGKCNITCYLKDNRSIFKTCTLNIDIKHEKGDVDKNGVVDAVDAAKVLTLFKNQNATKEEVELGDVDGTPGLSAVDAMTILTAFKNKTKLK